MENKKILTIALSGVLVAGSVRAGTSFTDALDYTGTSPTSGTSQPAFLASSELEVVILDTNEVVNFTASGAQFGNDDFGWGGNNYLMTKDTDYASANFTAEVTIDRGLEGTGPNRSRFYFGLGEAGNGAFNQPLEGDGINNTGAYAELQNNFGNLSQKINVGADGTSVSEESFTPMGAANELGTMRLRMDYDATAMTIVYSVDYAYAGGPFAVDQTFAALDVSAQSAAWAIDRSSIFLGGGGGNLNVYDLAVTVVPEPSAFAFVFGAAACGVILLRRRRA